MYYGLISAPSRCSKGFSLRYGDLYIVDDFSDSTYGELADRYDKSIKGSQDVKCIFGIDDIQMIKYINTHYQVGSCIGVGTVDNFVKENNVNLTFRDLNIMIKNNEVKKPSMKRPVRQTAER